MVFLLSKSGAQAVRWQENGNGKRDDHPSKGRCRIRAKTRIARMKSLLGTADKKRRPYQRWGQGWSTISQRAAARRRRREKKKTREKSARRKSGVSRKNKLKVAKNSNYFGSREMAALVDQGRLSCKILQDSCKRGLSCKILQDGGYLARSCKMEVILQESWKNLAR